MKMKPAKIKESLLALLKKLWRNLFLMMILLLLLDLILAGILFNKYYLKVEQEKVQPPIPLKINENLLNQFSSEWQRREEVFQAAASRPYPNLFQGRGQ